jgi:hypothetical protein
VKRFHLFELEDQSWFPDCIRNGGTDFLGFIIRHFQLYKSVAPLLSEAMKRTGHLEVLDLCSGSGEVVELMSNVISSELATKEIKFTLSDKFPNLESYRNVQQRNGTRINYISESVDVLECYAHREGFRTMFSAVHHFKPAQVKTILSNITSSGKPLAFFDGGNKSWFMILLILVIHPLLFFFCTPFIRPFRWDRLLFTYVLPIIPLYTIWDGIVSILRLHTPEQLNVLARAVDLDQKYHWQHGKARTKFGVSVCYLIGVPK